MTVTESVFTCLKKYADFDGRAGRSEFWWFWLFGMLVGAGMQFAADMLGLSDHALIDLVLLYNLLFLVPTFAVYVRRLNDVNRRDWWIFVPIALYWACQPGDAKANQYGPPPDR
jgi:uncharacterized membrane protein YhaH (DUF805 family)